MKRQSWIIVAFMIFGVFISIDNSNIGRANGSPPEIIPLQVLQPMGNTSVGINLNTGMAEISGTGDVSIMIEQPEKIISSVETRVEYVTETKYEHDIMRSTKLINQLMPINKPVLCLEKINPVRN